MAQILGTASNSTTSRAAWPTSWCTTLTSNSSWAASSTFAVSSRRACSSAFSVPSADQPTVPVLPTSAATGIPGGPPASPLSRLGRPGGQFRAAHSFPRQAPGRSAVAGCRSDTRCARSRLEELVAGDHPVEFGVADEVVVLSIDLPHARRTRRRGDTQQHVGVRLADVPGHGSPADSRWSGKHDEAAPLLGAVAVPVASSPCRWASQSRRSTRWRPPSPPTRFEAAIPSSCMARSARTGPSEGMLAKVPSREESLPPNVGFPDQPASATSSAVRSRLAIWRLIRPGHARRDCCPRSGSAIDLGWLHAATPRNSAWARSIAAAIPPGPAPRISRDT